MKIAIFYIFLFLVFGFYSYSADSTCIKVITLGKSDVRPSLDNTIETTHFIIHWQPPTSETYAQNAASYAEYAWERQCTDMNWPEPPSDGNRGENNKYDIYIVTDLNGNRGQTFPEIEPLWQYEWAPSYIEIIDTLENDVEKMTVAHEFSHACQFAYSYKDLYYEDNQFNALTWFYENTAVLMAEEVWNYEFNYYLHYFGIAPYYASPSPLRNPERGILYPSNDPREYQYTGFLWPKFLSEWTNDPDIVRKIWSRMSYHTGEHILDDTNFILGIQHSTSLDEAVRYYAEWRYYTGDPDLGGRDDGLHFSIASLLPTSATYSGTPQIYGYGGTRFIEFNLNADIVNVEFDGQDDYPWTAYVIEDRSSISGEPSVNKEITLDANSSGDIDAVGIYEDNGGGVNYIKIVLTPILNSVSGNRTYTFNGTGYNGVKQYFFNKIGTTNPGGYLRLDGNSSDDISSGDFRWLREGRTRSIETLNERFTNSSTHKHNNWNENHTSYYLNEDFTPSIYSEDANFVELKPAKVQILPEGFLIDGAGEGSFTDPWYVHDEGQGMDVPFVSSYEPNGKAGADEKGVFLDQDPTFDDNIPNYSAQAVSPKSITLDPPIGDRTFFFRKWYADPVNSASFENSNSASTGVVFKSDQAVVNAILKGQGLSDDQNAYSSGSQRKFIKSSSGMPVNVYSSMGDIWLEVKPYSSWIINGGTPINSDLAKGPSLDYASYSYQGGEPVHELLVIFQQRSGSNSNIVIKYYEQLSALQNMAWWILKDTYSFTAVTGHYDDFDCTPVISILPNQYRISNLYTEDWMGYI